MELKKLYSNIEKLNNMPDTLENHRAWKSTVDRILEMEGEKVMQEKNYYQEMYKGVQIIVQYETGVIKNSGFVAYVSPNDYLMQNNCDLVRARLFKSINEAVTAAKNHIDCNEVMRRKIVRKYQSGEYQYVR